MKKDQKINCTVHSCEHCDCDSDCCKLREVEIAKQCGCVTEKEKTICSNYKLKDE